MAGRAQWSRESASVRSSCLLTPLLAGAGFPIKWYLSFDISQNYLNLLTRGQLVLCWGEILSLDRCMYGFNTNFTDFRSTCIICLPYLHNSSLLKICYTEIQSTICGFHSEAQPLLRTAQFSSLFPALLHTSVESIPLAIHQMLMQDSNPIMHKDQQYT